MRAAFVVSILCACGDNTRVVTDGNARPIDAAVDAPIDADLFGCRMSSNCMSSAPICCVEVHAGGEVDHGCSPTCFGYTACVQGTACLTNDGTPGTCTEVPLGLEQFPWWVCQ